MSKGYIALAFTLGAAVGSVVTWKIVKTKYEEIARQEVEEVRAVYEKKKKAEQEEKKVKKEYDELINKYAPVPEALTTEGKEGPNEMDEPYVISPAEFGDQDGYEIESLTYYEDGVLTDEYDEPIEDIDDLIGLESLDHFGEYEDDSVFVRNDGRRTDYEILRDTRTYAEAKKITSPHAEG